MPSTGLFVKEATCSASTFLTIYTNACSGVYGSGPVDFERLVHRLVQIHPYPNGNGRHARLAADVLLARLGRPRFTWGSKKLVDSSETRTRYIDALRAADRHDYAPLLAFVRS